MKATLAAQSGSRDTPVAFVISDLSFFVVAAPSISIVSQYVACDLIGILKRSYFGGREGLYLSFSGGSMG
jgi:hypothetical protein